MPGSAVRGPAELPLGPVAPESISACVVCAFVAEAAERRTFFVFAESIGAAWFLEAMRRGGFCLRHARHIVRTPSAADLTLPYRELLRAWRARGAAAPDGEPGRFVGRGCPLCETVRWAESHALWCLAEPVARNARGALGADTPVCLPHLDRLLDAVSPWRFPEVVSMLEDRLREIAGGDLSHALPAIAGEDLDRAIRVAPPRAEPAHAPSRARRGVAADVIGPALDAGLCPVCEATRVAARRPIDWLADPPRTQDLRDLARLCGRHLHDAAAAPAAVAHAVLGSLRQWSPMLQALPSADDVGPRGIRARVAWLRPRLLPPGRRLPAVGATLEGLLTPDRDLQRRLAAARLRRDATCVACEAAVTATARTVTLLGALLGARRWIERFERSEGLCLRHVEASRSRLSGRAGDIVLRVADARAARLAWELDEAARLVPWAVRYEPAGPEVGAWSRAIVFSLGEGVLRGWPLGPDGDEVHLAA